MRVEEAHRLQKGDRLVCKRIGAKTFKPPVPVAFDRQITKQKKQPAQMWVTQGGGTFLVVNTRDVELEDLLQRIADKL